MYEFLMRGTDILAVESVLLGRRNQRYDETTHADACLRAGSRHSDRVVPHRAGQQTLPDCHFADWRHPITQRGGPSLG